MVFSVQYSHMKDQHQPLADRLRPRNFDEFMGQETVVGNGKLLRQLIEQDQVPSMVFWGPPGVGKTTLAQIIANATHAHFETLSGVKSGKADLLTVVGAAEKRLENNERTILFIDEIHRWNKAQQDALLPYVERGTVTLIGATTENPSFEIIGALLSRCRVFVLKKLSSSDIEKIIRQALEDKERGLGNEKIKIDDETITFLADMADGDARVALNALDLAAKALLPPPLTPPRVPLLRDPAAAVTGGENLTPRRGVKVTSPPARGGAGGGGSAITKEHIKEALQRTHLVFDKKGEEFYNVISALHKSMRGSDATAALYWLARMLEGGVDPLYVARRVVRFASEDIGMGNSEALVQAMSAYDACHALGMPECSVHLAQAVVYCAKSKKSNVLYTAYSAAAEDARNTSHLGVPLHIRNAPTKLMKDLAYGQGYKYPPDYEGKVDQDYLPPELKGRDYFGA